MFRRISFHCFLLELSTKAKEGVVFPPESYDSAKFLGCHFVFPPCIPWWRVCTQRTDELRRSRLTSHHCPGLFIWCQASFLKELHLSYVSKNEDNIISLIIIFFETISVSYTYLWSFPHGTVLFWRSTAHIKKKKKWEFKGLFKG